MASPTYVPVIPTDRDVTFDGDIVFNGTVTFAGAVGTGAQAITVAAAGTDALSIKVTGDSVNRLIVNGDGTIEWGPGNGAVDTNLYRSAANTLKTDDALVVAGAATLQSTLGVTGTSTLAAINCTTIDATGDISGSAALATTHVYSAIVTGDSFDRYRVLADGTIQIGPGNATRDTNLYRAAANILATDDDFAIRTVGKGLHVAEGANAKMGTSTLVAGTVTVSTTAVTATSRILLTIQSLGTVATAKAIAVTARTAATSFTITSEDNTDTSVIAWMLVEPA